MRRKVRPRPKEEEEEEAVLSTKEGEQPREAVERMIKTDGLHPHPRQRRALHLPVTQDIHQQMKLLKPSQQRSRECSLRFVVSPLKLLKLSPVSSLARPSSRRVRD